MIHKSHAANGSGRKWTGLPVFRLSSFKEENALRELPPFLILTFVLQQEQSMDLEISWQRLLQEAGE